MAMRFTLTNHAVATEGLALVEETHSEWHEKVTTKVNGKSQTFPCSISFDYVSIDGLIEALQKINGVIKKLDSFVKEVAARDDVVLMLKKKDGSYKVGDKTGSREEAAKYVQSKDCKIKYVYMPTKNQVVVDISFDAVNHTFSCYCENGKLTDVDGSD